MYFMLQLLPQKERGFSLHYSWSRSVMFTNSIKMEKWFSPKLNTFFYKLVMIFFFFVTADIPKSSRGWSRCGRSSRQSQSAISGVAAATTTTASANRTTTTASRYVLIPAPARGYYFRVWRTDFIGASTVKSQFRILFLQRQKNVKSQNKSWKKSLRRGIMPQRRWLSYFFLFWLKNWKKYAKKWNSTLLCLFFWPNSECSRTVLSPESK